MGRMPVFARKGAPADSPDTAGSPDSREPGAEDADTVTCPNCQCEFDPETDEVVSPPGEPEMESPVAGPDGAAADATNGAEAIPELMQLLHARMG